MKLRGNSRTQSDGKSDKCGCTKDKQTRAAVLQWLAPVMVLLLVIVIMLLNFMSQSEKLGAEKVEEAFTNQAEQYSTAIYKELDTITKIVVPVSLTMHKMKGSPIDVAVDTAALLEEKSNAFLVVICGTDGKGIDEGGRYVDLSKESWFQELNEKEPEYFYVENTPGEGAPSFVSAVPVLKGGKAEGYILSYYKVEELDSLIKATEHDSKSFYGIITEEGRLLAVYGSESNFLNEDNLLSALEQAAVYSGSVSYVRQRIGKFMPYSVGASYHGESRVIINSPLRINGWQFIMGVNQSYADLLTKEEVKESREFVQRLIIIMCAFFVLIVGINIFNRLRFNENSKDLEKQADTDLLTGLNNKIATERKIKEYINSTDAQALMFLLDIDNFKKINDTMGHAFGDDVLRSLGFGLAAEFRVSDILGRTGGDEFMIFLKNIKDQTIIDKEVSRVIRFFHEFKVGEVVKYSATASIGCAVYPRDADNFESLYKAADKALYKAKKRGKNQLAFYREEMEEKAASVAEQTEKE